ncbi:MAG TPA: hypothetical protein VN538_09470 [Clostridia bacterium]|nr:hypothetical protein [Clostridia bacterium]
MKKQSYLSIPRALTALLLCALVLSLCFAGVSPDTVLVSDADELYTALSDAAASGNATTIYFAAGTSAFELSGSTVVPSNVTIDLSAGGTLRVSGVLDVGGGITGGAIEVAGGTLLREFTSSITSTITASSGGTVRGARVLTLENLSATSGESITAVYYDGTSGADTSAYVCRTAAGVIYAKMGGANFASYQTIETVVTGAGNVFRLGTKNTDRLSLSYLLTYGGLTGATLSALNPTSYTASDSAILLNNPVKDGFVFAGWLCESLSVTVPQEKLVIPEGTTGELTFVAVWAEAPAGGGGMSGGSGSSSTATDTTATDDAQAQQEQAAAEDQAATQQSTRRTRTASSSTKVDFTSEVSSVVPSVSSLNDGSSFPWALVFGGLGALGIAVYFTARTLNRRQK